MAADEEAGGLGGSGDRFGGGSDDAFGATQEGLVHHRVEADGLAVKDVLPAEVGDRSAQPEFTGDDLFGEVTGADEVRNDVDMAALGLAQGLAEIRFLFPEGDMHFGEEAATDAAAGL